MAELIDTKQDSDTRFQWDYWGQMLEFHEEALLGILDKLPQARSVEDGLWRTIAVMDWLKEQNHSGGVLMRGLDENGEPLGSEDLPVLGIELTSESAEARALRSIERSRVMVACSDPIQVSDLTLWMPTVDQGPEMVDNLREVGLDHLVAWEKKIWQAHLDWFSSKRTPLMAIATLDGGSQGKMHFECLEAFLQFRAHSTLGRDSWNQHLADEIQASYPGLRIGQSRMSDLNFTIASPARLALIAARNLQDDTQPASQSRSNPPRL